MKLPVHLALAGSWLVAATLLLTYLWGHNPEMFPQPPVSFSIWLIELYGSKSGEDLADLELLYMLFVSFILVVLVTLFLWLAWRFIRNTLTSRSSGPPPQL